MRLLVFQHHVDEHPGQLRAYLDEDGVDWDAVELDAGEPIPDLEPYDMLWVMGGPMDVWDVADNPWLIEEKRAIRQWVLELQRPFFGLCLGHQLLADALNGTCGPMRVPEIGVNEVELTPEGVADPFFSGMPSKQTCLQWHSVQVAQPPEGAVVLASSPACPVQAMRIGPNAWSTQYHVEVETDTVENWLAIPAYHAALVKTLGHEAIDTMRRRASEEMAGFNAASRQLYENFKAATRID